MKAIRLRIREWRDRRGMSLDELSEKTRLSKGTLARIERGMVKPNLDLLVALSRAFECEPEELLKEPLPLVIRRSPLGDNVYQFPRKRY